MVAHYSNGGYTIEMVAIIFLYKLISSSFVIIPSHTSLSEREREKGEGRELKRKLRAIFLECYKHYIFLLLVKDLQQPVE